MNIMIQSAEHSFSQPRKHTWQRRVKLEVFRKNWPLWPKWKILETQIIVQPLQETQQIDVAWWICRLSLPCLPLFRLSKLGHGPKDILQAYREWRGEGKGQGGETKRRWHYSGRLENATCDLFHECMTSNMLCMGVYQFNKPTISKSFLCSAEPSVYWAPATCRPHARNIPGHKDVLRDSPSFKLFGRWWKTHALMYNVSIKDTESWIHFPNPGLESGFIIYFKTWNSKHG